MTWLLVDSKIVTAIHSAATTAKYWLLVDSKIVTAKHLTTPKPPPTSGNTGLILAGAGALAAVAVLLMYKPKK